MENIITYHFDIDRSYIEHQYKQNAGVYWFIGLSGSGKSTLANHVHKRLITNHKLCIILDADTIRSGLNNNLGFSLEDRKENIRRVSEVAKLLVDNGYIVLCCTISPTEEIRNVSKEILKDDYHQIYVQCSIDECIYRDPKQLYKKRINNMSGVSQVYEIPCDNDLVIDTEHTNINKCNSIVYEYISSKAIRK